MSIAELRSLGARSDSPDAEPLKEDVALSYGTIRGSSELRSAIASTIASDLTADDVLVTSGAISANFLILDTLLSPGDHVICQYPTYGQLFEVPRRAGAEVSLWRLQHSDKGWHLDIDDLQAMVKPETKLIILNNPGNPTGNVLDRKLLEDVVAVAKERNIIVLSDEVFRPLFHGTTAGQPPPSLLELGYERSIVTGSKQISDSQPRIRLIVVGVSKAYALPGIRLGWLATHPTLRDTVLQELVHARDYTTIAVSQLDDQIASFALSPHVRSQILQRSAAITSRNIATLEAWVKKNRDRVIWTKPDGAGTAVVTILDRNGEAVDDGVFAERLANEEGILAPPAGVCFGHEGKDDLKGGLRIGIVMREGMMEEGLKGIERLLDRWD